MSAVDHQAVALAFGAALKSARSAAGLSQEELADRAGLDRTTPSLYERGLRQPTIATLISLSAALGCDCALLLQQTVAEFRNNFS
jgi:XRE family transcriptional regulator, regulator of sulfur utilization